MNNDTRVDVVLADLIDHPGWEELINGVRHSIAGYQSKLQAVVRAKTTDEVVLQSLRATASIDTLQNFIRNVYRAADVRIPENLESLLRG